MKIEMTKVLEYLKPKVKALGFKKEVLEGIAADIADNLEEVEDDASDEDVNAKIKPAVDAVIPSLKLAQRLTNQGIEEFRKKQEKANEPPKEGPKEKPKAEPAEKPDVKPSSDVPKKEDDKETPKWVQELIESNKTQMEQQKQLIEALKAEVDGIKTKSTTEKRRALLDELLKDTGTFGKRILKSFEKMTFDSDSEFEEFVSDIKEDLEQLNQERANEGLGKFGAPKVDPNQKPQEPAKPKPLTDAEVEELASSM